MNYYYYGSKQEESFWSSEWNPANYAIRLQLPTTPKRMIFALVALYLCYRIALYLIDLICSFWSPKAEPEPEEMPQPKSSFWGSLFESTFVTVFGLTIGAVAFFAHKQQSTELMEQAMVVYRRVIGEIVHHSTGYDLTRSSLNPNETLFVGTLLAALVLYCMYSMFRFLLYHYIFGVGLCLFGLFLYLNHFPITSQTAANYSGTMFIIDRHTQSAHVVPSLIPKLLLTCTMAYYLLLLLLKSFNLFLRMFFRFLLYSLIATILVNSLASLLREPIPEAMASTFTSDHPQF